MTRWHRTLAFLAAGLVCLAVLLPLCACGPATPPPPPAPATAQVQVAPPVAALPGHVLDEP